MQKDDEKFSNLIQYYSKQMIDKKEFKLSCDKIDNDNCSKIMNVLPSPETCQVISYNKCRAIIEALKINPSITRVYLGHVYFGDLGALELANFLKTNNTINELLLAYNKVTAEGCAALIETLRTNSTLTYLNLDEVTQIEPRCIRKMLEKNTTLKRLVLGKDMVKLDDLPFLAVALWENYSLTEFLVFFSKRANLALSKSKSANFALMDAAMRRNNAILSHQRETLEMFYCLTLPVKILPDELLNLIMIAYYNTLA